VLPLLHIKHSEVKENFVVFDSDAELERKEMAGTQTHLNRVVSCFPGVIAVSVLRNWNSKS
jgi:hypothetical protein